MAFCEVNLHVSYTFFGVYYCFMFSDFVLSLLQVLSWTLLQWTLHQTLRMVTHIIAGDAYYCLKCSPEWTACRSGIVLERGLDKLLNVMQKMN